MYKFNNTVTGFLKLFILLASIPVIGAGIWMASRPGTSQPVEIFSKSQFLLEDFVMSLASFIATKIFGLSN